MSAKDVQRLEELETQVARLHSELSGAKRARDNYYNRLRTIENKIRRTVVVGQPFDNDGLLELRRMVPAKPRPTLKELHKRAYKKVRRG